MGQIRSVGFVSGGHNAASVGQERNPVHILLVPLQHTGAAIAERPETRCPIPGSGREPLAVARNGEGNDRSLVTLQKPFGFVASFAP